MSNDTTNESDFIENAKNNPHGVHGHIREVDIQNEMEKSYLDYAMSVIVGRALPDVRDGLKPVHRRVIYAMQDGGYTPDHGYNKCSRVVGDVMGKYHPHGDVAIYDTLVRLVQPWTLRYPLVDGQGNFGSSGDDGAAAARYTECRMDKLALELTRDIDKDTVDFEPNYDGKNLEPTVLPSRFPNLLANGSDGIAVGMATKIPPHNLRELAAAVKWYLQNLDATEEESLEAMLSIIQGPDFPSGALIVGRRGIDSAYRTGRGIVVMRAVIEEETIKGRNCLVAKELPYQVNPDNLSKKIRELVNLGVLDGIADMNDESSGRTGQRLVITLKRDAMPSVVLNNLYKHTQLQESFGCNMIALVDGVPRTLPINKFIEHWVNHQFEVIRRRTEYLKREAEKRCHLLEGYLKALDAIDEVIKLIRASKDTETARTGLMALLDVDEVQADAILAMQLRRLAALEHQKIQTEYDELQAKIAEYTEIIASKQLQGNIISEELEEIVSRYGDDRRTQITFAEIGIEDEALIPRENVAISITTDGYAKRTLVSEYKVQHRGGKGVKGAKLREDDSPEHFLTTSTHDYILVFSTLGKVYRIKGYQIPVAGRDAKGVHIANLLPLEKDEKIVQLLNIPDYEVAENLVLVTRRGTVKKSRLLDFNTRLKGGIKAINLKTDDFGIMDEVAAAMLTNEGDDLMLVSKLGMSIRFSASDDALRPLGRTSAGVRGIRFKTAEDSLLAAGAFSGTEIIDEDAEDLDGAQGKEIIVFTDGGYAKRTKVAQYRSQTRGGKGVKVANLDINRGGLVGALIAECDDQIIAMMASGNVVRSRVNEISLTSRNTKGVRFARFKGEDSLSGVSLIKAADAEDEILDDEVVEGGVEGAVEGTVSGESATESSVVEGATATTDGAIDPSAPAKEDNSDSQK
jgi:DNA gyrase subunit A